MTQTVPQLAARALRKLGVAVVPQAAAQADSATFTPQALATRALRERGIFVPEANRPGALPPVSLAVLAARTLRAVGINPIAIADSAGAIAGVIVGVPDIAARALRLVGVNPVGPIIAGVPQTTQIAQVAPEVLIRLGVVDPNETPATLDLQEATNAVQSTIDSLASGGVIVWDNTNIPVGAREYLIVMAMAVCGPAFGRPVASMDGYFQAENELRKQALAGAQGQALAETAVGAVHDRLAAMGLVSWQLAAIPQYAADAYVSITAASLVPIENSATAPTGTLQAGAPPAATRIGLVEDAIKSAQPAIAELRVMALSGPYGQALAVDKVSAVHDSLNAQGLVSWFVVAVPAAFAEDYVTMAATLLAPDVTPDRDVANRQADLASWDACMGRIRNAARIAGAQALAEARIADVQSELNATNMQTWPADAIPQSIADPIVMLVGQSLAASFGEKPDPDAYVSGMRRIRMVVMGGPFGQALAEQKVRAVHADLDARGKTRWSLFDLPDYAEEPYVQMAAYLLGPEDAAKFDPTWWEDGERRLNRLIVLPRSARPVVADYF